MSDESPPLRIKPRLKSESPADAPAADAPAAADTASTGGGLKITLRPKLSAPPPAAPAEGEAPPPPAAPAAERPRLKPRLSVEPPAAAAPADPAAESPGGSPSAAADHSTAPAAAPEGPKFKLKPKSSEPVPATLPVVLEQPPETPAEAPAAAAVTEAAPPPEAAEPAAASTEPAAGEPAPAATPAPVPKLKINFPVRPPGAAPSPGGAPQASIPKAKRPRPSRIVFFGGVAIGVLVLGVGGYFAYDLWLAPPPPPPLVIRPKPKPVIPPVAPADPAAKTDAAVAQEPASLAGKMVDKAQTTAAARTGAIDASDGLLEKRPSGTPADPGQPAVAGKVAGATEETMDKTKTAIAPGILATSSDVVVTAEASPAFRTWAANVRIAGVFPGRDPPRAVINSRAVDAGQIVDDALGIVFESVDADKKTLVFRDKTGARVLRKY